MVLFEADFIVRHGLYRVVVQLICSFVSVAPSELRGEFVGEIRIWLDIGSIVINVDYCANRIAVSVDDGFAFIVFSNSCHAYSITAGTPLCMVHALAASSITQFHLPYRSIRCVVPDCILRDAITSHWMAEL
ncbi:hypothetical protein MUK72_19765 (plasmid) [Halococcus dombrowskii]|uniref:Uncharacterized protein n=1 Tax=Halococcus dombrowskii TaxID=179637 RepID=A0AAX3AT53_HALDO|nr:hypothetical protein [Halococcus dombrowskii]UOO97382.1 hypothetical protein MUK72_19765 [Halococcus dombrowskii]